MAYMHGNLALQPKKRSEQNTNTHVKETKKVVLRRKSLPTQEKLLYLFTIAVCVIVAGVIIFRYAQIYQMNLEIREMTRQHELLSVEVRELQKKVEQLSDPEVIKRKAMEEGMVMSEAPINLTMDNAKAASRTAMNE